MAARKIVLISRTGAEHEEALAHAALSPGHLIKLNSAGKVLKHSTEGGDAETLFAVEDALQGKTTADAYAADDVVSHHVAARGDVVQAMLAPGANYAIGDELISAGDGTLKKASAASSGVSVKQIIATVVKAKNLSASGAVAALGVVRVR